MFCFFVLVRVGIDRDFFLSLKICVYLIIIDDDFSKIL